MPTVWYNCSFHNGSQKFCTLWEPQTLQTASNSVYKTESGCLESELRVNLVIVNVISDILQNFIRLWTQSRLSSVVRRH